MPLALKKVAGSDETHAWSRLPDVAAVSDRLARGDAALFSAVGRLLARTKQTSRFALTLLHSHFRVGADEFLVEAPDQFGQLVTSVRRKADVRNLDLAPKSWMFEEAAMQMSVRNVRVITWTERSNLRYPPLGTDDEPLLHAIASAFRRYEGATEKFGMALVGERPRAGKVWSEGTSVTDRLLVQQQVPVVDIKSRKPLRTMWVFDAEGRHTITMGCCVQRPSNQGHAGIRHRSGITAG